VTPITVTRPDGTTADVMSNSAVVVHGVDADGHYLGLVAPGEAHRQVPGAPPSEGVWTWNVMGGWERTPELETERAQALIDIDAAAGSARQRYITVAPGQEGTYLVKAEQARAFLAGPPDAEPPPYVAAEAQAMGGTHLQAAQLIAGLATQWNEIVGPAIEQARRGGKIAVEQATDLDGVRTALAVTLSTLSGI
jgi:hypothetical protein